MKNADKPINPIFNAEGYPTITGKIHYSNVVGLTKREYFAAMAMQGFVVNRYAQDSSDKERVAKWSIAMADELLNQLEK